MDARLQTAVSSGEEYSMISVQRLDDLMVPRFFWFDFPETGLVITNGLYLKTYCWHDPYNT
jgi:hypothetical protein